MKTENFTEEFLEMEAVKIRVVSYKIGEEYYCHVHNVDPGAVIARSNSASRETAREEALRKARQRLLKTAGHH